MTTVRTGYDMTLFSRPQMHQLFLSKIPKEKLHLGKKIESIEDSGENVTIHCANGSSASGDILVGADGAYSSVRTSAINALQDAVILANCIYDITSVTPENINEAFADYRNQRYPKAKYQIDKSKVMATIQYGQTWKDRAIRHIIFNWIPKSIQTEQFLKDTTYRPQVMFLPNIENRGTVVLEPQRPCKKYVQKLSEA
ncbi:hypothetical protein BGZ81_008678 [Podila clonocystis]|nr:hypothetical protein BGZ81_008678 [Podila clonocystis]